METLESRWGVELVGASADILNLEHKINGSIRSKDDFFVSRLDECVVLRTSRWDASSDFEEARSVAQEDVSLLVSCLYTADLSLGLEIGTIFHFREDSAIDQQRTSSPIYIRINPTEHTSPNSFKDLVDAARSSVPLRVAASEVTAEGGWFEIFKAIEGLKRFYGTENKLLKAFPHESTSIERMKRTANSFRHAAGTYAPISKPLTLGEAKALVRAMLIATLTSSKVHHTFDGSLYGIPNITSGGGEPKFGLKPLILGASEGTAYVGETLTASS